MSAHALAQTHTVKVHQESLESPFCHCWFSPPPVCMCEIEDLTGNTERRLCFMIQQAFFLQLFFFFYYQPNQNAMLALPFTAIVDIMDYVLASGQQFSIEYNFIHFNTRNRSFVPSQGNYIFVFSYPWFAYAGGGFCLITYRPLQISMIRKYNKLCHSEYLHIFLSGWKRHGRHFGKIETIGFKQKA